MMEHIPAVAFYLALLNCAMVLVGYRLIARKLITLSWMMLVLGIAAAYIIVLTEHPVTRMLAIIATTFTGMKVVAVAMGYKDKKLTLKFTQWLVFALGWAGMRAQPFETLGQKPLPNAWPMIGFGVSRVFGGALLILLAYKIVLLPVSHTISYILVSTVLLVGLSLTLHFGILSISAGIWRLHGANTYYLFKQPAKTTSLAEFWSKRWNIAFSEMTSVAVFRPLKNKTGGVVALLLAFIFSGLLHELALSVPVNSGYGLPSLYFLIQGVLVLTEQVLKSRNAKFLQRPALARMWTLFWVIAPAPLLFHPAFLREVIWPLVGISL